MTDHNAHPDRPEPLWIDFHLLDRQIVDHTGAKIGKVDDVELDVGHDGRLIVTALLVGQQALGQRIGGLIGRWLAGIATRLRPEHEPPLPLRIAFEHVTHVDTAIIIGIRRELFPTPPLEAWLHDKIIGRIPGAPDASK
jgi:sporulation protein YlmC with PRC-barrel domain